MNRRPSVFTVSGCNQAVIKSPTQFACFSTLNLPLFATIDTHGPRFVIRYTNTRATMLATLKRRIGRHCVAEIVAKIVAKISDRSDRNGAGI